MPDLLDIFKKLEKDHPNTNIAGYVALGNDGKWNFYYEVSGNPSLPAAVYLFDSPARGNLTVYTNVLRPHWLYTYMDGPLDSIDTRLGPSSIVADKPVQLKRQTLKLVAGEGGEGPLKNGGLYAAAEKLIVNKTNSGRLLSYKKGRQRNVRSEQKGMNRALRYYMLAAYALLGKGIGQGYGEGKYISALLVSDKGKILSWGMNSNVTGDNFHHGEVNMLLNYFATSKGQSTLPKNCVVFSTLTPCQQCADYLQTVRANHTYIFMGQKDGGRMGSAGEASADYLRDLTDPVRVVNKKGFEEGVEAYPIDASLAQSVKGKNGTAASRIGKWCSNELTASVDTLNRKGAKDRNENLNEQQVKVQVLGYLNNWLKTVQLQSVDKVVR